MTRDDFIRMAREQAGSAIAPLPAPPEFLVAFGSSVWEAARDHFARVCDEAAMSAKADSQWGRAATGCAFAIRNGKRD